MKLGVDSTEACLHYLSPYPEKKHTHEEKLLRL